MRRPVHRELFEHVLHCMFPLSVGMALLANWRLSMGYVLSTFAAKFSLALNLGY